MSLPLDAPLPGPSVAAARAALARAKRVGEEYRGVEVATATVRTRSVGAAIVDEARRRGVEAIVLAADESGGIRAVVGARCAQPRGREQPRADAPLRGRAGAVPRDHHRSRGAAGPARGRRRSSMPHRCSC